MCWFSALYSPPVYHRPCFRNAEQRIGLGTLTSTRIHQILHRACLRRSWEDESLESHEITAFSGNVSRDGAVLGNIRGPIQEAASIHMQTVHIIQENSGHQHSPPPAFLRMAWELESTQLPPCEDIMHTMHTNYQAGIWRCSIQQHPQVPCPVNRGWVRNDDGQLTVELMGISSSRDTAAAVVVQVQP